MSEKTPNEIPSEDRSDGELNVDTERKELTPLYKDTFRKWLAQEFNMVKMTIRREAYEKKLTDEEAEALFDELSDERQEDLRELIVKLQEINAADPLAAAEAGKQSGTLSEEEYKKIREFIDFEKIIEVLKSDIGTVAVHGREYEYTGPVEEFGKEKRWAKKEMVTVPGPDLDGRVALYLLELAGIKYSGVLTVPKGGTVTGKVHIDTGPYEGPTITEDGSIYFSGHGEKKPEKPTSASKMLYETLVRGRFLEPQPWLDRLTQFATEFDNLNYPLDEEFFRKYWWRTLYGVHRNLPVEMLVQFFKEGRDPRKPFEAEYAKSVIIKTEEGGIKRHKPKKGESEGRPVTLFDLTRLSRHLVEKSIAQIETFRKVAKKAGLPQETDELGKIVFNIIGPGERNRIPEGYAAVKALGYDTYILWDENYKSFFVNTAGNVEEVYKKIKAKIPAAQMIRGAMILLPRTAEDKSATLEKLLESLNLPPLPVEKIILFPPYKELYRKWLEERGRRGAKIIEREVKKTGINEDEVISAFMERQENELRPVLIDLQSLNKENPLAAAEEAHRQGRLPEKYLKKIKQFTAAEESRSASQATEEDQFRGKSAEDLKAELERTRKEMETLEGIRQVAPEVMTEEGSLKIRKLKEKEKKLKSAIEIQEAVEQALKKIDEFVKHLAEISGESPEKFEKMREEIIRRGLPVISEILEKEKAISARALGQKMAEVLFGELKNIEAELFPKLYNAKLKNPEAARQLEKDLIEAFLEPDEKEFRRKLNAAQDKAKFLGDAMEELNKILVPAILLRKKLASGKPLSEKERKDVQKEVAALKSQAGGIWEKLGMGLGFAGLTLVLSFFLVMIMLLHTIEILSGQKKIGIK
jgi:hypothetical protein